MRDSSGRFQKGHSGNSNGRPKRAEEQFLIDIWEEHGQKQFLDAVKNGERWALKSLVDKLYPNKKPIEQRSAEQSLPQPILANLSVSWKE